MKDLFQFQTNQANAVRLKDLRSNRKIRFLSLCVLLEYVCADKQVNAGKERTKESKGFLWSLSKSKKSELHAQVGKLKKINGLATALARFPPRITATNVSD